MTEIVEYDVLPENKGKVIGDYPGRISGESEHQYVCFLEYLRLGAGRRIVHLDRKFREANEDWPSITTLRNWSRDFLWDERAREFDRLNGNARAEYLVAQANMNKLDRVTMLSELGNKLVDRVAEINLDDMSDERVIGAIKVLFGEMRAEFNDMPTQKFASVKRVDIRKEEVESIGARDVQNMCKDLLVDGENG